VDTIFVRNGSRTALLDRSNGWILEFDPFIRISSRSGTFAAKKVSFRMALNAPIEHHFLSKYGESYRPLDLGQTNKQTSCCGKVAATPRLRSSKRCAVATKK
jgi:hypothetical protein